MRKIRSSHIVTFVLLLAFVLSTGIATIWFTLGRLPLGDFRGVTLTIATAAMIWCYAVVVYRVLLYFSPLPAGEIHEDSRAEFVYDIYVLFYLMFFNPVMRSGLLPIPMTRMLYRALGARIGENTYSGGTIYDAPFVELGSNCLIGDQALLVPHVIEGQRLALYPIRVGNGVTIGARATVLPGVTIGDNAIVATGAVVTKGTTIAAGEIWGGIPAHRLKEA